MTKDERKQIKQKKKRVTKLWDIKEETMEQTPTEYKSEVPEPEEEEDSDTEAHLCWRCALKSVYGVQEFDILKCSHVYRSGFLRLLYKLGARNGRLLEKIGEEGELLLDNP